MEALTRGVETISHCVLSLANKESRIDESKSRGLLGAEKTEKSHTETPFAPLLGLAIGMI